MRQNFIHAIVGDHDGNKDSRGEMQYQCQKIEGIVVLMKKNVLDFNDFHAPVLDGVEELLGQRVSLQLISAVNGDSG